MTHKIGCRFCARFSPEVVFTVYGCFTHLRIVHPTDRPACMVRCSDCTLYGLPTVTTRRQLGSSTRRFDH